MKNSCNSYLDIHELYRSSNSGWFFAVYKQNSDDSNIQPEAIAEHNYARPIRPTFLAKPMEYDFSREVTDGYLTKPDICSRSFSVIKHKEIATHKVCSSNNHKTVNEKTLNRTQSTKKKPKTNPKLTISKAIPTCQTAPAEAKRKKNHKGNKSKKPCLMDDGNLVNKQYTMQADLNISELQSFHDSLRMHITQCRICFKAWPVKETSRKDKDYYMCTRCLRDKGLPKKFSFANNMVPCPVPPELQDLSQCEEMLIARAFPVMQVYLKPKYGTVSYKGHCITLPHNVQNIASILPHTTDDIPVVVFTAKGLNNTEAHFRVRRMRVLNALHWLKNNNPLYQDITIDLTRVELLPEDDFISTNKVYNLY